MFPLPRYNASFLPPARVFATAALFLVLFRAPSPVRASIYRASVSPSQATGDADSTDPSLSADGRFVAFSSGASNLAPGDTNRQQDILVKDLITGAVEVASTTASGQPANGNSNLAAISADGRYVAFLSSATNLVPNDTNKADDIFVKDMQTGAIQRANVSASGEQANGASRGASISADGRYVAFVSAATNLVPGDTNDKQDVFAKDMQTGAIQRASVSAAGDQQDGDDIYPSRPSLSADGRYIAFASAATNLVPNDKNGVQDVFVKDLQTGAIQRASVTASGQEANGNSYGPSLSADDRHVAFQSAATNLVSSDTNGWDDIFVTDLQTGAIQRASVSAAGGEADGSSSEASISANGRYVAFWSRATTLVSDDTNGNADVFVKDTLTGAIQRVSVAAAGQEGDDGSYSPSLSADGGSVAFWSYATNLVAGQANYAAEIYIVDGLNPPMIGDVNGDGTIDIQDALLLLRIDVGLEAATPSEIAAGDVRPKPGTGGRAYGDDKITLEDVIWLLQRIAGLETAP